MRFRNSSFWIRARRLECGGDYCNTEHSGQKMVVGRWEHPWASERGAYAEFADLGLNHNQINVLVMIKNQTGADLEPFFCGCFSFGDCFQNTLYIFFLHVVYHFLSFICVWGRELIGGGGREHEKQSWNVCLGIWWPLWSNKNKSCWTLTSAL